MINIDILISWKLLLFFSAGYDASLIKVQGHSSHCYQADPGWLSKHVTKKESMGLDSFSEMLRLFVKTCIVY